MRTRIILACGLGAWLACGAMVAGDPPARPRALTAAQARQLAQLEQQPQHSAVNAVQATYTTDKAFDKTFTRISDDVWTIVFDVGVPTTIIVLLVAASVI